MSAPHNVRIGDVVKWWNDWSGRWYYGRINLIHYGRDGNPVWFKARWISIRDRVDTTRNAAGVMWCSDYDFFLVERGAYSKEWQSGLCKLYHKHGLLPTKEELYKKVA